MSTRLPLLSALCALGLCGPLLASDEAREPYQVRIVLDVAKHRLLTDVFRDQIQRELHDGIQAGLGELARVEVTYEHPLLSKIRAQGLKVLDLHRDRSSVRTYFVLIDFSGTHYHVQTRLFDGLTGLPSPVVRTGRTHDRAYVARVAAFLMERDISLLGTLASEPDESRQVRLDLKGGGLGVDLGKWVKKGEVFQLLRDEGGVIKPEEGAYLQVVAPPRDGQCLGKLFSRYKLSRVAGQKAVLLGTRSGPLRLRVLQERDGGGVGPLATPVTLQLRKHGFEGEEASRLQQNPIRGEVNTARAGEQGIFDRLAFVSVLSGDSLKARIPVPILDDSPTTVVVPATSEEGDLVLTHFRAFARSVREALNVQNLQFDRINKLNQDPDKRPEALKAVRASLERLRQDHDRLTAERNEVREELKKLPPKEQPRPQDLQQIDERLAQLKSGEAELLKIVGVLEKIEKEENDPRRKESRIQIESAKLLEREAEVGKALDVYAKVPEEFRPAGLSKHIQDLKKLWEPKDEKHRAARRFIYDVWPGLDTAGLKARMSEARQSFAECERVRDPLGPAKMRNVLTQHRARLEKELEELKPGVNSEDEKPAQLIKEVAPQLQKLDEAIQAFLEKVKPGT